MITASAELQKIMQDDRPFIYRAVITFKDSTIVTLTEDDMCATGCSIVASSGSSSFPLGAAICRCLTLSFYNLDDGYAGMDFMGAKIAVTASVQLSQTTETLYLGTFTVTEPEEYGVTITVTAYDDFYLADKLYETALVFPLTAQQVYVDACTKSGLVPLSSNFPNSNYEIKQAPESTTCRQLIGMIAMLAGGNAVVSGNNCKIVPYDPAELERLGVVDGGIFDDGTPRYSTGDNVYGGIFNPWDEGDDVDGGTLAELRNIQLLTDPIKQTISTDDIVITGITIKSGEDEYTAGTAGYVLELTNALTDGNEQDAVNRIAAALVGMKFRSFEISLPSYPLAELFDVVYLNKAEKIYASIVTDITFNFKGTTILKCSADDPVRNSSKQYTSETATTRQLRQEIAQERTAREAAVESLEDAIDSKGFFTTVVSDGSGGQIMYMHDAPQLAQSHIVWKVTSEAIAATTNYQGEQTQWTFGVTVNGTVVAQIMNTIGIDFSWGTGGTLTLGGANNVNGNLRMLNASGQEIGSWNKDGITAMSLTAYGSLICYESYTIT